MVKGHADFLKWLVSVSTALFFYQCFQENLYWKGGLAANINVSPALTYSTSVVIHKMIYISSSLIFSHSQQRVWDWVILMDSEPFSWAVNPPTNMWWWSSILLQQQIPHSTDPSSAATQSFFCSTCVRSLSTKEAVFLMRALQLGGQLKIILLIVVCFHVIKQALQNNPVNLPSLQSYWCRETVYSLNYTQFSRDLHFIKKTNTTL